VTRLLPDLPLFAATADPAQARSIAHDDALRDALAALDPDRLSPREALQALYDLKSLAADAD
jgi:DNA mismatch repair protein MutS